MTDGTSVRGYKWSFVAKPLGPFGYLHPWVSSHFPHLPDIGATRWQWSPLKKHNGHGEGDCTLSIADATSVAMPNAAQFEFRSRAPRPFREKGRRGVSARHRLPGARARRRGSRIERGAASFRLT